MSEPSPTEKHLEAYRNIAANLADAWFTMKMTDREEMERMGREVLDRMFTEVFRSLLHQVAEGRVRLLHQELALYEAIDEEKEKP